MSDISNFVLFRLKNLKLSPPPDSGGCTGAELQDPPLYAHFSHMFSLFCRDCLLWHKFSCFLFPHLALCSWISSVFLGGTFLIVGGFSFPLADN